MLIGLLILQALNLFVLLLNCVALSRVYHGLVAIRRDQVRVLNQQPQVKAVQ